MDQEQHAYGEMIASDQAREIERLKSAMREAMATLREVHGTPTDEVENEVCWSDHTAWVAFMELKEALERKP